MRQWLLQLLDKCVGGGELLLILLLLFVELGDEKAIDKKSNDMKYTYRGDGFVSFGELGFAV